MKNSFIPVHITTVSKPVNNEKVMTETTSKSGTHQVDMAKLFVSLPRVIGLMIVASILITVTTLRLDALASNTEAASWRQGFISASDRSKQLECLARNIYWESANQPFEGKVAVAQVTMNRVEDGRFGKDVCGVVYAKNVVYDKVVCQFSWYCEPTHKIRPVHPAMWEESMEVAKKVLLEGFRLPSLKEALYFHADYVNPRWPNMIKLNQIGNHIFYKKKERKI
jgi:spore germination cell wall hydrolase CwlJ-like protein